MYDRSTKEKKHRIGILTGNIKKGTVVRNLHFFQASTETTPDPHRYLERSFSTVRLQMTKEKKTHRKFNQKSIFYMKSQALFLQVPQRRISLSKSNHLRIQNSSAHATETPRNAREEHGETTDFPAAEKARNPPPPKRSSSAQSVSRPAEPPSDLRFHPPCRDSRAPESS